MSRKLATRTHTHCSYVHIIIRDNDVCKKGMMKKKEETRRNDVYTDIYLDDEIIAEVV